MNKYQQYDIMRMNLTKGIGTMQELAEVHRTLGKPYSTHRNKDKNEYN